MHARIRICAMAVAATAATALAVPAPAQAAGPVYSGTGWKAATVHGIHSLDPTSPYLITFASTTARTRLSAVLKTAATQVTSVTGVKVSVTTTIEPLKAACPTKHHFVFETRYRPVGTANTSMSYPCSAATGAAWGGQALIDSEYWATAWTGTEMVRKNIIIHELGHLLGLDHPNYDRDKDGLVERYECVRDSYNRRPVLCSPNGGDFTAKGAGKYISFDLNGLKQLAKNWAYRP